MTTQTPPATYVRLQLSMPSEPRRRLDSLARMHGCSRSEFVRRLIDQAWRDTGRTFPVQGSSDA